MKTEPQKHLFASDTDGHLYDTRRHEWHKMPLRTCYRHTFARIKTGVQLRATLRAGDITFPGCYPLYFITSDGGALSFDTVRANLRNVLDSIRTESRDGWRVVACEVNYEDSELYDDHTGEQIPSAYGED
jgi:hypothetical protein